MNQEMERSRIIGARGCRWYRNAAISLFTSLCLVAAAIGGCVAQQADVVRIKRELDGKIRQLNSSRSELQEAVAGANKALREANAIIAQQRGEIQELLHARAELMDQLTTLKDGDLSEVRGELETHAHQVRVLAGQFVRFKQDIQETRHAIQRHVQAMEPLLKELQGRLDRQEEVLMTQGQTDHEFRQALVDFQSALTSLRDTQKEQQTQLLGMRNGFDQFVDQQTQDSQRLTKALKDIEQSLHAMVSTIDNVNRTLSDRVEGQDRKLSALAKQINGLATTQTGLDQQQRRIDQVSDSVMQLQRVVREALTQIGTRVDAHEEVLTQLRRGEGTSVSASREAAAVRAVPAPHDHPVAAAPTITPPSLSATSVRETQSAWDAYRHHRTTLRQGNLVDAIHGFRQFLEQHPHSPLAANAQYWLGECYYGQREFRQAIAEFERVVTLYPKSEKVPAALLKIGYSHLELKDPVTANAVFRQLVRLFPDSPEAAKAYARMAEVGTEPKGTS